MLPTWAAAGVRVLLGLRAPPSSPQLASDLLDSLHITHTAGWEGVDGAWQSCLLPK